MVAVIRQHREIPRRRTAIAGRRRYIEILA
jgi:hypothetical protein